MAATSAKVVIVETDLRNPTLSQQHGLKAGPGLADLLTHQVELDAAIQSKPVAMGGDGTGEAAASLDVIVPGSPPGAAGCSLCRDGGHKEQLTGPAGRHGPVVVDTAPIGVVADARTTAAAGDRRVDRGGPDGGHADWVRCAYCV